MDLTGRTAVITGAASGIGAACARELHRRGADVVLADRDAGAAQRLSDDLGEHAYGISLDVADVAGTASVIDAVAARSGTIDILVNNAGIYAKAPLLEVTEEHFDRLFAVNVRGMFFVLEAVAKVMTARGTHGAIVNIASQAGRRGEGPSSIYAATKATVISLTQSAALALAGDGIRVNAVAPGVIDTPMWQEIDRLHCAAAQVPAGTLIEQTRAAIPIGRLGSPDEIARVVAFLASPDSSYVLGQTWNVDGGNVLS